ncbi:Immunoglobulin-like domain [Trinorchestia longiramus]|nr:Immunoglobulin-like domain [Trinorchestia longiramus]
MYRGIQTTSFLLLPLYVKLTGCVVLPSGGGDGVGPRFVSEASNITVAEGRSARLECTVDGLGVKKILDLAIPYCEARWTAATTSVNSTPNLPSLTPSCLTWSVSCGGGRCGGSGCSGGRCGGGCGGRCGGGCGGGCGGDCGGGCGGRGCGCGGGCGGCGGGRGDRCGIPPVIVDGNSSRDVTADEGKDVTLTCDARGRPTPSIRWVREDGGKIPSGETEAGEIGGKIPSGGTEAGEIGGKIPSGGTKADEWVGPKLRLGPLQRSAAGAFLCIASNGVPPTVSKRVLLSVNFAPVMEEPQPPRGRRIGAPPGSDVKLSCLYTAHPPPQVTWYGPTEHTITTTTRTSIIGEQLESHRGRSSLSLKGIMGGDYGRYMCEVRNNRGRNSVTFLLFDELLSLEAQQKECWPHNSREFYSCGQVVGNHYNNNDINDNHHNSWVELAIPAGVPHLPPHLGNPHRLSTPLHLLVGPHFTRVFTTPTTSFIHGMYPPKFEAIFFVNNPLSSSSPPAAPPRTTLPPGLDRSGAPSPRKHTGPFLFGRSLSSGSCWRVAPWLLLLSGYAVLLKIKFTEGFFCE